MTTKLAKCPCGEVPTELIIIRNDDYGGWASCSGNCCNEWIVEVKLYGSIYSPETYDLAVEAWNNAPRGGLK